LNQVQDAEEVTQDTFARAYRNLHMFRGEAAFASWLYQIGTNLARNRYWHGRRRGAGRTLSLDQPCSESGNSLHAYLACSKPGPIEAALLCETIRALRRAYPRLPANYREILSLRLREDLSYEDIAQRLAVPLGTVKSRLARARQALAESIAA
jgi:RNA polymerase sigma-70 factor (ECF subfamily)